MGRLQWNEPKAYHRCRSRRHKLRNPWDSAKFAATAFLMILGIRVFAEFERANPDLPGWMPTLVIAAAIALFFGFVFPVLISFISISVVVLSESGVNNNVVGHGATLNFWPWSEIAYCSTSVANVGNRSFQTLSLHDAHENVLATFALANSPTVEEVREWLNELGKRIVESAAECPAAAKSEAMRDVTPRR